MDYNQTTFLTRCFYFEELWWRCERFLVFSSLKLGYSTQLICYVIEPKLFQRDIAPKPRYLPTFMQIFCTTLYPHPPPLFPARHNIRIYGSVYFPWKIITAFHKYRGGLMAHICVCMIQNCWQNNFLKRLAFGLLSSQQAFT